MEKITAKLETRHKIFFFVLGLAIVVMVFYTYVYQSQQQCLAQLNTDLQMTKQKVQVLEGFLVQHPDLKQYEKELQDKTDLVNSKLPADKDISSFIMQIEDSAKKTNVKLNRVKPIGEENKENYRGIKGELDITGDYFQTLEFLKKLEQLQRFNTVTDMSVQAKDEILNSKLSLLVYSYGVTPTEANKTQNNN